MQATKRGKQLGVLASCEAQDPQQQPVWQAIPKVK